jgi:hypothetical protein
MFYREDTSQTDIRDACPIKRSKCVELLPAARAAMPIGRTKSTKSKTTVSTAKNGAGVERFCRATRANDPRVIVPRRLAIVR